jgi:hypothetical protein
VLLIQNCDFEKCSKLRRENNGGRGAPIPDIACRSNVYEHERIDDRFSRSKREARVRMNFVRTSIARIFARDFHLDLGAKAVDSRK